VMRTHQTIRGTSISSARAPAAGRSCLCRVKRLCRRSEWSDRLLRFRETPLSKERNDENHPPPGGIYCRYIGSVGVVVGVRARGTDVETRVHDGPRPAAADSTNSGWSDRAHQRRDRAGEGSIRVAGGRGGGELL